MKTKFIVLLSLVFSILVACSGEEKKVEETYTPAVKKEVKEYYNNGKLKTEGELRDGQRHGRWRYYYENGFLWSEGIFHYGVREGVSLIFHDNGYKKVVGKYKNNKAVGEWEFFNEEGKLTATINAEENPDELGMMMEEGAQRFTQ